MRHLFFPECLSRIAALQPQVSINYPNTRPWNNTVDRTQQDVAAIVEGKNDALFDSLESLFAVSSYTLH